VAFPSARGASARSWTWLVVGSVGLLAALAGSALPQLVPGGMPQTTASPKQEQAATGDLKYSEPAWPETPSAASMLSRLAIGTGIVLVLCVGTLWAGKRWLVGPVPPKQPAEASQLRLLEALALGNRCSVQLIQAGSRQVLVGLDSTGMKAVVPLNDTFEHALDGVGSNPPPADSEWLASEAHGL